MATVRAGVLGGRDDRAGQPGCEADNPGRELTNLIATLPADEQYTYVFEGNAQVLDHVLLSAHLVPAVSAFDVVHVNAEFGDGVSDHDPQVVHLDLSMEGTPEPTPATPVAHGCA